MRRASPIGRMLAPCRYLRSDRPSSTADNVPATAMAAAALRKQFDWFMGAGFYTPNDERSHAGPLTPGAPRDELPALAAAIGCLTSPGPVA